MLVWPLLITNKATARNAMSMPKVRKVFKVGVLIFMAFVVKNNILIFKILVVYFGAAYRKLIANPLNCTPLPCYRKGE